MIETFDKACFAAFDMDGLMFDTEAIYWRAADALLGRRGFKYTQELCDEVMGRPPEFCFKRFIEVFGLTEDWKDLQRESEDIFIKTLEDGCDATPGLVNLLDELRRRQIPCCVCTSSSRRVASEVLKTDRIGERFEFVLTSDDITRGKPDPEIYETAARRFGTSPGAMLVFEDSSAGCASAVAAGSKCCMLRASHNTNADFSRATLTATRLDDPAVFALLRAGKGSA